jgi:predicted kinase
MADTPPTSKYQRIAPLLERQPTDPDKPVALLTCGLAGSGKSTLSKTVVTCAPHFTRLSVDEIVGEKHGLYGVDYPADEDLYDKYLDEAGVIYVERLAALLEAGKDVVLDRYVTLD